MVCSDHNRVRLLFQWIGVLVNQYQPIQAVPKIFDNSTVEFGNPGGGWRKIVLRGVLRGGRWKQALRGGGGFVLLSNSGKTFKKKVVGV